ncbi:leucine-rich repeat protein [Ruminococcus albus]|uniref:Leucine rich repeat-containing protein n=1 Tax=Ruminococcus albus TaxID=1264 RepID=A0A1I1GPP5_RUMAL|nr:leucine-rich repeat protein [Ruminococcus albus]SFC11858.1 Leucine rich repeat-containing protein [Ruminococcus albus]
MRKKLTSFLCAIALFLSTAGYLPQNTFRIQDGITASAENAEDFGYNVFEESVTILSYFGTNKSVDIPSQIEGKPVTRIERDAFNYNCENLISITIPDTVTSIGMAAFAGCKSLTSLEIPDSVTSIDIYAFSGCTSLKSIKISDSITSIGKNTFYNCRSLTNITIPDSVKSIGEYAFCNCASLTGITIPDGVTSIDQYTFSSCSNLTSITIPDSVTNISYYAFYNCESLKSITIPESVTSIGDGAFAGCTNLASITIPDSVTIISYLSFYGCTSLTSIMIPNSVKSIYSCAFSGCTSLTRITIPDSVNSIGEYAFCDCASLTGITIPDGVTSIGDRAFYNCTNLTSVTISYGVKYIGVYAFSECMRLTNITIPDGVERLEISIFDKCENLTSIEIPNSVTTICDDAFFQCTRLTDVYYIGTPAEWESINIQKNGNDSLFNAKIHFTGHKHVLTAVPANAATCEEGGNPTYWYCNICDKYFSDEKGFNETTKRRITLPPKGHTWSEPTYTWSDDNNTCTASCICVNDETHVETETVEAEIRIIEEATCSHMGKTSYIAKFNNSKFETQRKINSEIPKTHHTWGEWNVTTPATEEEEGVQTRICKECGETETRQIPKLEKQPDLYIYAETETVCSKDSDEATTITINRITDDAKTFENFKNVEIDGKVVSSENYTAKAGSLILTFKPEFLKTLSDGEHIVKVNFTDGDAELKLRVSETSEYVLGDVSGDGKITITDITKVAAHVKGKKLLTKEQQKRADVNRDNKLTITDITKIAAHVKGKKLLK